MKIHTFEIEIEEYLREREGLSPEEYARLPMGAGVGTAYTGRVMLGGISLFSMDVTKFMRGGAPTRREEAEGELMHQFALKLVDALERNP